MLGKPSKVRASTRGNPERTVSSGARSSCTKFAKFEILESSSLDAGLVAWVVEEISEGLEFQVSLVNPDRVEAPVFDERLFIEQPGRYQLQVPNANNLMATRYRLVVQAVCNQKRPSHNYVAWDFLYRNTIKDPSDLNVPPSSKSSTDSVTEGGSDRI